MKLDITSYDLREEWHNSSNKTYIEWLEEEVILNRNRSYKQEPPDVQAKQQESIESSLKVVREYFIHKHYEVSLTGNSFEMGIIQQLISIIDEDLKTRRDEILKLFMDEIRL